MRKPILIDDWRTVLRRAWSLRLQFLATVLGCAEVLLPMFSDLFPRYLFAVMSFAVGIAAMYARVVAQPKTLGVACEPPRGTCTVPPTGWWCSREAGHEGPCAARPESER